MKEFEAETAMNLLLSGALGEGEIKEFLLGLRAREVSADEIVGFVRALRGQAVTVPSATLHALQIREVMDVCGTGGDGLGTFNVSTIVSFVLAAAGVSVAKHGNRSVSSRSGSFDVLEALGIAFESSPDAVVRSLGEHGLGFLFAPSFHPGLKTLAPIRKSLGVSTIFNLLGPLLNPVEVTHQLMGVYDPSLVEKVAYVLKARGLQGAMVVCGEDGLDEVTLTGPTRVAELKNGEVRSFTLSPEDFGLKTAPIEAVRGGGPEENARTLVEILSGSLGPRRDLVLLNAAAALVVARRAGSYKEGVSIAEEAIDAGRASQLFTRMGGRL